LSVPDDYPNDVAYRTTTTGIELTRIPIPSRKNRFTFRNGPDCWWPTPEPPHRINQIYLEPILFRHAEEMGMRILDLTEVESFSQNDDAVTVQARGVNDGDPVTIRARYMIGCDGGRSTVRKAIGAQLIGDPVVQRVQSTYIRAPKLIELIDRPAWATFSLNPRRCGNVYAIDGRETWLVHNYLRDDEPEFESVDRDRCLRHILGVGPDFEYEILNKEDWIGRRMVADKFRNRRVFLCGDSAHIWVPFAGYGMNAGIADAANLAWLLAACLHGWAPPAILDAYEAERHPITEQVSHFAMNHAAAMARQRKAVPPQIEERSLEGEHLRAELGFNAYCLNVQQYCCGGLNFGYFYDKSPIIAYDGAEHPGYSMYEFTPSTVPGCRVPHFFLEDGRSLYDVLGDGYTLLRFDREVDVRPLVEAAEACRLPLEIVDLDAAAAGDPYRERLVLARPDQHVAWRGQACPERPSELIDRIRGAV
jgi:2-polyprenyl-6-methoxyphenol hydroxylase-like FAD-dependent oxidoreductase